MQSFALISLSIDWFFQCFAARFASILCRVWFLSFVRWISFFYFARVVVFIRLFHGTVPGRDYNKTRPPEFIYCVTAESWYLSCAFPWFSWGSQWLVFFGRFLLEEDGNEFWLPSRFLLVLFLVCGIARILCPRTASCRGFSCGVVCLVGWLLLTDCDLKLGAVQCGGWAQTSR
jgi:hypothetical protein